MTNVDWRNRYGANWITSVRDQQSSENCWAFASTALYEAMVRIEHCLWNRRSEGDLVHGVGKQSWDLGNIGESTAFVERYGLADPDCFPFGLSAALYTAKEGGGGATPLSPTPDRAGRTVRIASGLTTTAVDVAGKKLWIDGKGPMATMVNPPADFALLRGQIYTTSTGPPGPTHALLIVGFNDDQQYWIVKNSWGTGWGVGGFGMVGYAANLLEPATFIGLHGTSPDPWARRRLHNGVLIQSSNGAGRNNFELFARSGPDIMHWWRENSTTAFQWNLASVVRPTDPWRDTFHDDALDCPAVVQSTFNRNFELVYRSTFNQLRHVFFDQAGGLWQDATIFGPVNPQGIPGFVQSNRGAPGDFEVVVLNSAEQLEHWTKHNSWPWTQNPGDWSHQATFGSGIAYAGPALVQSSIGVTGYPENGTGELHYVATSSSGSMGHFHRDSSGAWSLVTTFGQGIASGPCMIESSAGMNDETGTGNFELCVAVGGQIQHWWRSNNPVGTWSMSAVFGTNVNRVVALIQSSFTGDLEVIAERADLRFQHYYRDTTGTWNPGPIINRRTNIAVTGVAGWTTIPVALANGDGTWTVTNQDAGQFGAWAASPGAKVVAGDFNGNGLTDLAVTGVAGWTTVPVAFAFGNGTWTVTNQDAGQFGTWAASPGTKIVTGDFNGNGRTDLALTGVAGGATIPVAFSNADGTWNVTNDNAGQFGAWAVGAKIVTGDFNGNGRTDLVLTGVAGWATIPVAFSNGDGNWTVTNDNAGQFAAWATAPGVTVVAGDFNGNGRTDLALTGVAGWATIPVAFSNGDGNWTVTNDNAGQFAAWATAPGVTVVAGDFNGNGRTDLALTGGPGWTTVPIAFSNGDGTWTVTNQDAGQFAARATAPGAKVVTGDFNGNGRTDLALTGGAGWTTVPVAFSNGDGTWTVTNQDAGQFAAWAAAAGAIVDPI